ncbi:hypothetical protein [uncultured Bacteroides sp.]|uniref:hypothetical protein n=1 Tax=uncultured Bacteroides sp. TaxID=162156 RepID=UPI002619190C|nr:hypothetical protein [uncultured Bacteroides sp.]
MIEIKDISGKTRFSTQINKGAKGKFTLMKEDYIILPFSVPTPIPFKLGDYVDLAGVFDESLGGNLAKIYEITDLQKPTYNSSTGGYDYKLQMNAYYWKWKNKIFKYTPEQAGREASWSLTAALDVQLGVFLRNLKALGYTYRGEAFTFSIDDTVENKAVAMSYDNINLLDALFSMAGEDKWNCDCWITDNVIHFGRNEFGDAVKIERGVEASSITRSESQGTYATRIYAFGSTKNIPTNYRPTDEQAVINGVVQKRLMLPADTPYIDAFEGMSQEDAIEDVVVFDDVYPRRVGTLSDVHTRTEEVENEDGTKETVTYYRYKDTGLEFKEEYIIEGQELKIKFQSGKLNGMEFGVIFNPEPKDESRGNQLWEIVRNEDYGRPLPDDIICPADGDEYVLSGFDIQLVSDQYIPDAEQELKEKAQKYADKVKTDDGTYPTTLRSSWVKEDLASRTFEFGQRINLVDDTYFENGRISRVLGWEINLDIPWDSPVYTIGESMPYSRIGEIEDKVDSLTYKGQTYIGGGGGIYLIRVNDKTAASDSNAFSALRSLKMFQRKDKTDENPYLQKFLDGLEVGEFIDSLIAGKGIGLFPNGRAQLSRLEVRESLSVLELIFNRLSAMESDYSFSESGTVESVTQMEDGTYTLKLRKRWENDFTALQENDIIYGVVNNLASGGGEYYTSWARVLSVDTPANSINVVLYPDSEVPGGKNYPPVELMMLTRRGNPVNEDRQSWWYLSSREKCLCMLDGVTKPVLEESNYSVIVGKLKQLSIFDNLPINYRQSYVYCRGIAAQDVMRIDYQGNPIRQENQRGLWSAEEAVNNPYQSTQEVYDSVYHYGCKWMCLLTGTTQEPRYGCTDWAMIEGNPAFSIDIESSNGWYFDAEKFDTTLSITGMLYNRDVTAHILDEDVSWTRDTGNVTEDNAWAAAHAESGKVLPLTLTDLGPDYMNLSGCKFIAKAILRDGQENMVTENYVTF